MDNYALVERLGQGAFAIVWKARRKSDNRVVAVKQLKQAPSTWEECKRLPEIRAAGAVRGQHIIALLEAVRHGNELFLVFEYADSDLYRCLGPCERRRYEEPQVRWVMRQLFSALATVHAAGFVHCDVKPENILMFGRSGPCGEPVMKLCDLGQACSSGEVGSYVGTRWYRSPELLLGINHNGCEIDLWAAGCLMAELIFLRPPFPGTDTRDMLFRICSALGAPEDGWWLNERLTQASGLRFAPCAAEGPLWLELSSTGASSSAVEIVRGMLRYDQTKRLPAARVLSSMFFQNGQEVALMPPEKVPVQMRSAEGLARSRDEAKAVSRKLEAASAARGVPSGFNSFSSRPAGSGLGGLGLMGSVLDGEVYMSASTSSPSLPFAAQPKPFEPFKPAQAGYSGHSMSTSSSSQGVGFRETNMGASRLGLPLANRRMVQAVQNGIQNRARMPRDLTQGGAMVAGLPPPSREFPRPNPEGLPPPSREFHRPFPEPSFASGPSHVLTSTPPSQYGLDKPLSLDRACSKKSAEPLSLDLAQPPSPAASSSDSPVASPVATLPIAPRNRLAGRRGVPVGSTSVRADDTVGNGSAYAAGAGNPVPMLPPSDEGELRGLGALGDDEELAALFWSQVDTSRPPTQQGQGSAMPVARVARSMARERNTNGL